MSSLNVFFQRRLVELSYPWAASVLKGPFFFKRQSPRRTLKAQKIPLPGVSAIQNPGSMSPQPPFLFRWLPVKSSCSPTDASTPAHRPSRLSPHLRTLGDRAFSITASTLWKALTADIHATPTLTCLRCLKQRGCFFLTWLSASHFLLFVCSQIQQTPEGTIKSDNV